MKLNFPKISLHPQLMTVLDFVISALFILSLSLVRASGSVWIFFLWYILRLLFWLVFIFWTYFPPSFSRWRHFATLFIFWSGVSSLLFFIDWNFSWWLVALVGVAGPAASFYSLPYQGEVLSFMQKPWRRTRLMLAIFGLMGLVSGFFAAEMFALVPAFMWWVPLAIGFVGAFFAKWWWWEYELSSSEEMNYALLVFTVLLVELTFIIRSWSLGYFADAFLFTWGWFLGWLMLRFHLTSEDIVWKRQAPFLLANLFILILFLFFVRWR